MDLSSRTKRLIYLTHRWTGVVGCLLMALWFVSGVVMLYIGYPKLTPWERFAALPELPSAGCCVATGVLPPVVVVPGTSVTLTSIAGVPAYVLSHRSRRPEVYSAGDGQPQGPVTPDHAMAEANAFLPGESSQYMGAIHEDRWTHSRGLDVHRPLHRVDISGDMPGTLYVSSATGQVVLDAPRFQQRWNYVGAWLHWLYMFRNSSVDPVWSWLVIGLSALCTVSAVSGMVVGLWRWRFRGRYKTGARTPYRERWMRWHHLAGLIFGGVVLTWAFSGLMSMNPLGLFSPADARPDLAAYHGRSDLTSGDLAQPSRVIQALHEAGFAPVELHWRRIDSVGFVLAYDRQARTRLVHQDGQGGLAVRESLQPEQVLPAARHLFAHTLLASQVLSSEDAYYYRRHPEAMNGARQLGFPALRLDFSDPGRTRVYIDLQTGAVAMSLDTSQRVGRWLFYFLHSWDTPGLLRAGLWRDVVLIVLSLGGLVVAMAGVVIAWRRVRHVFRGRRA